MDNYAAHKRVEVRNWLAANRRIQVHFTPDLGIVVEPGRGLVRNHREARNPARHFVSVKDLNTKIHSFINGWNDRCHPFVWTETADGILKRERTVNRLHKRSTSRERAAA